MRKPRAYAEVYNDLDGEIVNAFRVLQGKETSNELLRRLLATPFSRDEFNLSYEETNEPVERARRMIIRAYQGFGTNGHNGSSRTGFRAMSRLTGSTPVADWVKWPDGVGDFFERLRGVVIENRDALEVMAQQDTADTLFFVDPPYVHSTRTVTRAYRHEMDDSQHEKLCDFLGALKGMVILCGYNNPIYDRLGWKKIEKETYADGPAVKCKRIEVLWLNPATVSAQSQQSLFGDKS